MTESTIAWITGGRVTRGEPVLRLTQTYIRLNNVGRIALGNPSRARLGIRDSDKAIIIEASAAEDKDSFSLVPRVGQIGGIRTRQLLPWEDGNYKGLLNEHGQLVFTRKDE